MRESGCSSAWIEDAYPTQIGPSSGRFGCRLAAVRHFGIQFPKRREEHYEGRTAIWITRILCSDRLALQKYVHETLLRRHKDAVGIGCILARFASVNCWIRNRKIIKSASTKVRHDKFQGVQNRI
jgi:hypothetical protein